MAERTEPALEIIVIEDDDATRSLLEQFLAERGYGVRSYATGEAGVLAQQARPADLILTDLSMPGMSGIDVLMRVRQQWPATEVVVLTGYASVESAVEALRHGAYDFLLKPARLPQIESAVKRCAERIRYARENRELREVVDRLEELNRRREKFIALVNHELRTPVTVASGVLSLALQKSGGLPPETASLLRRAEEAMKRLGRIVEDVGDLAAVRAGSGLPCREPVPVGEAVRGIARILADYAERRALRTSLVTEGDPARTVRLNLPKFLRAMEALIQNGIKSTPDGGIVHLTVTDRNGSVEFSVRDTGVGVPAEERETIFEPFYKVGDPLDHRTSDHEFGGGGIGIGLALARSIAEAHGGKLRYEPAPGGGSIFTLSVPL
jgi:signal transduction histidine kinase